MDHSVTAHCRRAIDKERKSLENQILSGVDPADYVRILEQLKGLNRAEMAVVEILKKEFGDDPDN